VSDGTKISWSEATWNPISGCTKTSEGCTHCYIDRTPPFRMAHRKFNGDHIGATTGVKLHSERLGIPMKWRKPRRIFVCSLGDRLTMAMHPAGMVAMTADNPFNPFERGHPYWEALRRAGKKATGRLLEGREWNEYPDAKRAGSVRNEAAS
jgi:protein gp37